MSIVIGLLLISLVHVETDLKKVLMQEPDLPDLGRVDINPEMMYDFSPSTPKPKGKHAAAGSPALHLQL